MPCHNLCSVYPLLRYQQREHYLQAQRNKQTPTIKKKVPFMQSVGEEKAPSPKPYLEEYAALKKGPWTVEEDAILLAHVTMHGDGNWNSVKKHSGIFRCGKSCRLRWFNHLRPDLRRGPLQADEERLIIEQHANLGNSWSRIAAMLPGRTDNEIKNFWNTRLKRLSRAGLPLYPPPEETTSTLEDVEEDICATCGPSNYNMASSTALNNPSDCGFNSWNWSYTSINVANLIAVNALVLPAAIDGDFSGLKEAVGSKLNGTGMHKRDMPSDKRSIFNFSDVTLMQPLSKRRCLDGIILDSTVLCDPNPNLICHSSPRANLSCGTEFGYSASNMTNNLFATVRHGKGLPCLKVELHSVQSVESADSSSALSSPFAASQALHFSDHDTLNSTCNTPVNNEGGSLLDVVFQQQKPGHDQLTSVVSEQASAVFITDAPVVASTAPSAEDAQTTNDNPHSLLGGYSLVLLKDDFGSGELQSDSPLPSLCGGSSLSFELPADLCEISAWTVPLFDQEEVAASAVASNVADLGHDGIGSSLWDFGSCVWSNMPGTWQACPAPESDDNET